MQAAVIFKGIRKYFPGTKALDWDPDDQLEIYPGEIHGLVGENGAGKSTLFQVLMGIYERDAGEILLNGRPFHARNANEAEEAGISIIMQQPNFAYNMTVAENIFMSRDRAFTNKIGLIDWKKQNAAAQEILDELGYTQIKPTDVLSDLGFEERKKVEIARALSVKPKVLLVDETSAAISKESVENLYTLLREQKAKGIAIIYISHFIDEVYKLCDRVSVLRDGKLVAKMMVKDTTMNTIISSMVGRDISNENYRSDSDSSIGEVLLETKNLSKKGHFSNINLQVRKGEIVGLAGIAGCGADSFGRVLFGYEQPTSGSIFYRGQEVTLPSSTHATRMKIGYVPKDRDREGLFLIYNLIMNISSANLVNVSKRALINHKLEKEISLEAVKKFKIKTASVGTEVQNLSGGNRQKVAIAKWVENDSDLLIVNSPTRGVDVGAKYEIYRILEEIKNSGKGVLLISDELPELLGMSDRIYSFRKGVLSGEVHRGKDFTEENVVSTMV